MTDTTENSTPPETETIAPMHDPRTQARFDLNSREHSRSTYQQPGSANEKLETSPDVPRQNPRAPGQVRDIKNDQGRAGRSSSARDGSAEA